MSITRVIVYAMHEHEHDAAVAAMRNIQEHGEAFLVGEIDDSSIPELERAGLVIEPLNVESDLATAATAGVSVMSSGYTPDLGVLLPEVGPDDAGSFVVSLDGPLSDAWAADISDRGISMRERVSNYSWVVGATADQAAAVSELPFVLQVERPQAVPPDAALTEAEPAPEPVSMVMVDLVLDGTRSVQDMSNELVADGVEILATAARRIRIRVSQDHPLYGDPRGIPGVAYGSLGDEATLHNDRVSELLGVTAVRQDVRGLDGDGEVVAVLDTGIDATHQDFDGRIKATFTPGIPGDATDRRGHGTHVAGTILGDGASSAGRYRGIAPKANLVVQASANQAGALTGLPVTIGERLDEAYQAGARVHNNSWGLLTTFAEYSADCWDVDEFVWSHRDFVVVFSAGNDASDRGSVFVQGTGYSVTAPGTAKNVVTVGAARSDRTSGGRATATWGSVFRSQVSLPPIKDETVSGDAERLAAFSGRGPCTDRRIKPDVVATGTDICSAKSSAAAEANFWGLPSEPGYAYLGGTSMAAPAVAGCCALIRQWYRQDRDWQPSAALVKATLVNGARWLTGPDAAGNQDEPPNNDQGFGCVDLRATIPNDGSPTLRLVFADTWTTPARQFRSANKAMTWEVDVAPGTPLRICMAYTDAPGRGVQNDLNMYVEQPNSAIKLLSNMKAPSRSAHGLDKDNAVEVIRVAHPQPGTWRIRVLCGSLTRRDIAQDYALVVTGDLTSELRFRP